MIKKFIASAVIALSLSIPAHAYITKNSSATVFCWEHPPKNADGTERLWKDHVEFEFTIDPKRRINYGEVHWGDTVDTFIKVGQIAHEPYDYAATIWTLRPTRFRDNEYFSSDISWVNWHETNGESYLFFETLNVNLLVENGYEAALNAFKSRENSSRVMISVDDHMRMKRWNYYMGEEVIGSEKKGFCETQ